MLAKTILVVEDDPNDETLTLRALSQMNVQCSVVVAHNGQEALDYLKRSGKYDGRNSNNPQVIFVDNTLPGLGGVELVRAIREIPEVATVPIVVLSGNGDSNLVDRCCRAGANSFLEKPFELGEYVRQIGTAASYWLTLNHCPAPISGRASAL
jgi:CheY-like chemotaxis protein